MNFLDFRSRIDKIHSVDGGDVKHRPVHIIGLFSVPAPPCCASDRWGFLLAKKQTLCNQAPPAFTRSRSIDCLFPCQLIAVNTCQAWQIQTSLNRGRLSSCPALRNAPLLNHSQLYSRVAPDRLRKSSKPVSISFAKGSSSLADSVEQ